MLNPGTNAKKIKFGEDHSVLTIESVPLAFLTPDPKNARKHNSRNLEAIKDSLAAFGQQKPIVVSDTGVILSGNGAFQAAKSLGWESIDVVRSTLQDAQAVAYGIADNKTSDLSEWDFEALSDLFTELDEGLLDATGWKDFEFKESDGGGFEFGDFTEDTLKDAPDAQLDRAAELQNGWGTERGQVWNIGKHRLACGDCTDKKQVDALMDGFICDICFTSPPYALGKSIALRGNTHMTNSAYIGFDDPPKNWVSLMDGFWSASESAVKYWIINIQLLAGNKRHLLPWVSARINRLCDVLTWDKGHGAPIIASGVCSSRFEWLFIFGDNDQSRSIPYSSWRGTVQSVYQGPPQHQNIISKIHGATMPVHLPTWVFETLCDKLRSVFDPFLGSGTTMVAAEQLGRICYGMEIEPKYVAVTLERMKDMGVIGTLENPTMKQEAQALQRSRQNGNS